MMWFDLMWSKGGEYGPQCMRRMGSDPLANATCNTHFSCSSVEASENICDTLYFGCGHQTDTLGVCSPIIFL